MRKDTKDSYLEAINRAIEFIEANLSQQIKLEDIADYSLISKYHFHRIFKSIIGHTAKEYLTRLRLEKAALLLKNTSAPIHEIAYDCGYASPETFNRSFKNYFATTPSKFREKVHQIIVEKSKNFTKNDFEALNLEAPRIKTIPDLNLAYIRHFGAYQDAEETFGRLIHWASKSLLLKEKLTTVGIVHDDPYLTKTNDYRFDACLMIDKEIQAQGEVGYKKVKGGKFAIFRYHGPYDAFYPAIDYIYNVSLFDYQYDFRDQPALEWYIQSAPLFKPDQYITDFYLPID